MGPCPPVAPTPSPSRYLGASLVGQQQAVAALSTEPPCTVLKQLVNQNIMQVPQYNPAGFSQAMAQQLQQQSIQLRMFWEQQHLEIQQVGTDPAEFKNHQLPLARIKKVTRSCTSKSLTFSPCKRNEITLCADHEVRRGCANDQR